MPKTKGGLSFRSLYGFNIALLGKHCWNFMHNPDSLVSRVFKARHFPDTHVLKATKGQNPSFVWQGILMAKDTLYAGYRWVVGNGQNINATKDRWLKAKKGFCVDNSHFYAGRDDRLSNYIISQNRSWNVDLVIEQFLPQDARAILATLIPQMDVRDRLVWASSSTGVYVAKDGYKFWLSQYGATHSNMQSKG